MLTPAFKSAISDWNRDELRRAVGVLYAEKGFVVEPTQNLPEPIAFLSRANLDSADLIAVGCLAAGNGAAPTTQIQLFWQRMQERQIQSGVMVTNGRYEAAAIEFAAPFSLLLIDFDALAAALGDLPEQKLAALFPQAAETAPAQPAVPEQTQSVPFKASSGLLGAPAGQKTTPSEPAAEKPEVKPYPLPAAAIQPDSATQAVSTPTPAPAAKADPKPAPTPAPKVESAKSEKPAPAEPKPKAETKPAPKTPAPSPSWKPRRRSSNFPVRKMVAMLAILGILGGGGYFAWNTEPLREKITAIGEKIWEAGPFGESNSENEPVSPAVRVETPPPKPVEPAEPATPDRAAQQQLLVQRVALLEELKTQTLGEQRAGEAVTIDRLALEFGIDFVELARGDLRAAVRLMTGEGRKPGLELPADLVSNPHFGRLRQHPADELTPFLTLMDGRIELQTKEIDIDAKLASAPESAEIDGSQIEASLQKLDRRLYVHGALEARRRAQSIAGVVGSAKAAGVDFVDGKTEIATVILMAVRGAKVENPDSPFDGVEFRVPAAFTEPREKIMHFLRIRNGILVYEEELDPSVKVKAQFAGLDYANDPEKLAKAIEAAEGLIRAANMELMVQRELKLDRLLAPVTGMTPSN